MCKATLCTANKEACTSINAVLLLHRAVSLPWRYFSHWLRLNTEGRCGNHSIAKELVRVILSFDRNGLALTVMVVEPAQHGR